MYTVAALPNLSLDRALLHGLGTMNICFKVNCKTRFGQEVAVVGGHPAIGNWDPTKARTLTYSSDDWWVSERDVGFAPTAVIEYKYILREGANLEWEFGDNRKFYINDDCKTAQRILLLDHFNNLALSKFSVESPSKKENFPPFNLNLQLPQNSSNFPTTPRLSPYSSLASSSSLTSSMPSTSSLTSSSSSSILPSPYKPSLSSSSSATAAPAPSPGPNFSENFSSFSSKNKMNSTTSFDSLENLENEAEIYDLNEVEDNMYKNSGIPGGIGIDMRGNQQLIGSNSESGAVRRNSVGNSNLANIVNSSEPKNLPVRDFPPDGSLSSYDGNSIPSSFGISDAGPLMRRIPAVNDMPMYAQDATGANWTPKQKQPTPSNLTATSTSSNLQLLRGARTEPRERDVRRSISGGILEGEREATVQSGSRRGSTGDVTDKELKNINNNFKNNINNAINSRGAGGGDGSASGGGRRKASDSTSDTDDSVPSQEKAPRPNVSLTFYTTPSKISPTSSSLASPQTKTRKIEEFIEQVANNDLEICPTNPLQNREDICEYPGFFNKFVLALQSNTNITKVVYPTNRTIAQNKNAIMEFTTALMRANSIGNVTGVTLFVNVCGEKIPQALHVHNDRLEHVAIKWCPLSLEIAHAWAAFLKDTSKLKDLTYNVGREGVDNDTCGMLIAEALERNKSLERVKLRSNDFGEKTALQFSRVLKFNSTITYLDLSYNNLTLEGFRVFFKALSSSVVKTLILKDCEIDDNCVKKLGDSLKVNTSLTKLSLFSNSLGPNGAKFVAESLVKNFTLQHLDLYANKIEFHGAEEFAKMLRLNCGLEHLNLQNNGIKAQGVQLIAEALHVNTTLKSLNLAANSVGNAETALCKMFTINTTLTKLDLRFTDAHRHIIEHSLKNRKRPLELVWLF